MKRILEDKWKNWVDTLHIERLTNIKPQISIKNPLHFEHLVRRRKKELQLEGLLFKDESREEHGDREVE